MWIKTITFACYLCIISVVSGSERRKNAKVGDLPSSFLRAFRSFVSTPNDGRSERMLKASQLERETCSLSQAKRFLNASGCEVGKRSTWYSSKFLFDIRVNHRTLSYDRLLEIWIDFFICRHCATSIPICSQLRGKLILLSWLMNFASNSFSFFTSSIFGSLIRSPRSWTMKYRCFKTHVTHNLVS